MRITTRGFKLTGGKELVKALRELPEEIKAERVVSTAMRKAAKPLQEKIRAAAPEDTGRLRMFIAMRSGKKKDRIRVFLGALRVGKAFFDKHGLAQGAYYARMTEFGTKHQRAQHWMEKAVDGGAQEFLDQTVVEIKAGIDKAVTRLAKKQQPKT